MDVNGPQSQEDFVSNWELACCLVEEAISGVKFAPFLPTLTVARLASLLLSGDGTVHSRLTLLSSLFCEWASSALG